MKFNHKMIVAPLAAAVLLVIVAVMTALWAFQQTTAAAEARKHSYATIIQTNALLSELKDSQSAERGYLLTDDETLQQPYLALRNGIGSQLKLLRQFLLSSEVRQQVDKMAPLVEAEMADISKIIELHGQHDIAGTEALASRGRMDTIRTGMGEILSTENNELAQHEAVFQSNMNRLFAIIISASLLALLLVVAFGYLVYLESRHRQKDLLHLDTRQLLDIEERTNRELRHANMTLQVSEEKAALTLKSIADAVIVTDAAGHVTLLNSRAEKLTGWTQAEACNHRVNEVFRIISHETRLPPLEPLQVVLKKGSRLAHHSVLIRRDGSECAIADSWAPIRDASGKVGGAVLMFRDVTAEYALQQELRDNAALIKTILNSVVDGVITIHASGGMIATVNAAAEHMFGYSAADIIGKNFSVLVPELDRDQRNGSLEYYSPSEEARAAGLEREVSGQRKDGRKFPLEIAVSEMWLAGKRYFTCILRDIGARKRIEAERNMAAASAPMVAEYGAEPVVTVRPHLPRGAPLRTLLYVEDNPANLELVEQLIARRDELRLLSAADGQLGIEFARTYQPDVILMDINLPGISGIEVMKMLHQDATTAHIPIIALSANALPRDIERGLEAGFFNYLTKPIKVNQFMDALNVALEFAQDAANRTAEEEPA